VNLVKRNYGLKIDGMVHETKLIETVFVK